MSTWKQESYLGGASLHTLVGCEEGGGRGEEG
jgi:hypothetical protein